LCTQQTGRVAAELKAEFDGLLARHTAVTSKAVAASETANNNNGSNGHHTSPRVTAAAAAVEAEACSTAIACLNR
jgi:hypothetical protein